MLQPRYRRLLALGDLLDEGIRLFRQHWVTFALVSAVALIPPGLLVVWLSASASFSNPISFDQIRTGRFAQAAASAAKPEAGTRIALAMLSVGLSMGFYCVWSAAVAAATEAYLRGGEPTLVRVYRRALRRFWAVLLGTLMYVLALSLLAMLALPLLVVTAFGGLAGVVPGVALLVWWLRPSARKAWLKWLIIVCIPFGLVIYFAARWSVFVAAAVLERLGPLAALRRSSQLAGGQVFRVLSILGVTTTIVAVLEYTPTTIVSIPLMVSSGLLTAGNSLEAVITESAAIVLQILFQSVGAIVYTLMFVDLRNRHEGTDLAERLAQLEFSAAPAGG